MDAKDPQLDEILQVRRQKSDVDGSIIVGMGTADPSQARRPSRRGLSPSRDAPKDKETPRTEVTPADEAVDSDRRHMTPAAPLVAPAASVGTGPDTTRSARPKRIQDHVLLSWAIENLSIVAVAYARSRPPAHPPPTHQPTHPPHPHS
jgi:hypothetical protein